MVGQRTDGRTDRRTTRKRIASAADSFMAKTKIKQKQNWWARKIRKTTRESAKPVRCSRWSTSRPWW